MTQPSAPRPPLLVDDTWTPPPRPSRLPAVLTAAGIAVVTAILGLVVIREAFQPPESPQPVQTSRRSDLWYPSEAAVTRSLTATSLSVDPPKAGKAVPRRPVPAPGYLSVNSMPWAALSVDGRKVGNTPQLRIRVASGRHQLLLARDGFETQRTWVTVAPGDTVRITGIALERVAP